MSGAEVSRLALRSPGMDVMSVFTCRAPGAESERAYIARMAALLDDPSNGAPVSAVDRTACADAARGHLDQALALARAAGDPNAVAAIEEAIALLAAARTCAVEIGDRTVITGEARS